MELSNPVGWAVPGLKAISRGRISPTIQKSRISDHDVIVSMYVTEAAKLDDRLARLPFLLAIKERQNAFLFQEIDLAVSRVWVYECSGRRFAYIVVGARYVYDKGSKTGGFADEIRLVFEDRNGDGKYELMLQGSAAAYAPPLPNWAQRTGMLRK